jgi:hypothetical protein
MIMNKMLKLSALSLGLTAMFASGVMAAPAIQEITAYLRPDIKLVVDGTAIAMNSWDGTSVIPISYNGTTYLPLRALGNALNKTVTWDNNTQTVYLGAATIQDPVVTDAEKQIAAFNEKATALTAEVNNLVPAAKFDDRIRQYLGLAGKINTLSNEIDVFAKQLERDFQNGKLIYSVYNGYNTKLDAVEDRLEQSKDLLTAKTIQDDDIIVVDPDDDDARCKDENYKDKINNAHGKAQSYKNRAEALLKQMKQLNTKNNQEKTKQYKDILAKLDRLDDEIDDLEKCLKTAYNKKQLTAADYQSKINALGDVEKMVLLIENTIKEIL